MKDIAHHRKHIQKKILKEARQSMREEKSPTKKTRAERTPSRQNPEYEGDRFDPHHRKPRLLKRINYH